MYFGQPARKLSQGVDEPSAARSVLLAKELIYIYDESSLMAQEHAGLQFHRQSKIESAWISRGGSLIESAERLFSAASDERIKTS